MIVNITVTPNPYKGSHGPLIKPGFTHFFALKNLLKKTSRHHPKNEPTKNKNTNNKKYFIISPEKIISLEIIHSQ
jgi:hypothetical protein